VIVNRPGFPFREDVAPFRVLHEKRALTIPEDVTVFHLPFVEQPISSTEIRDDRKRGAEVRGCLPPLVWNYIERNKLYS
jgi:nicotinic acid mononucleotide adenylyltransferase